MFGFFKKRETLLEIAKKRAPTRDAGSKHDFFYEVYSPYLEPLREKEMSIFEIGVLAGESTKILANYFARSQIYGVDIDVNDIDLDGFDNITLIEGDQCDHEFLTGIAEKYASDGIDIVIDDASHFGKYSLDTFNTLFPLVKSNGLYIVEDWGTGYWPDWPDGEKFEPAIVDGHRIVSHDFGMVGFAKHLIDHIGRDDLRYNTRKMQNIESMSISFAQIILRKA